MLPRTRQLHCNQGRGKKAIGSRRTEGRGVSGLASIVWGVADKSHEGASYGCFHKLGSLFLGGLTIRTLLFGVYNKAPDFRKLPY